MLSRLFIGVIFILWTNSLFSFDKADLEHEYEQTPFDLYLGAQEAYDLKTANPDKVLFLDVRTLGEIHYTGIADTVDANIPYKFDSTKWKMKKNSEFGTYKKVKNPDFVAAVENAIKAKGLSKDSDVIIMCTTGTRAPFAAKALHKAGFTKVHTQVEGFEGVKAKEGDNKGKRTVRGWKVSGLPWSYNLLPEKMYSNFAPKAEKKTSNKK